MKKKIGIISVLIICLLFVGYVYLKKGPDKKENDEKYVKSVVFKDQDNDLIPISVNFNSQVELEADIRNRIELMKSNDLIHYGLYPILNENLSVQSIQVDDNVLTIDFNDELYDNQTLDLLEALTYTMTDYEDINQLKITINGEKITYLPNSTIPLNTLTKDLGLNNFEETSALLHQTIPVMVYHQKQVNQFLYYVPTTIRLDENESLKSQVQTILNYVQSQIHLLDASIESGVLTVELDSNILLDNESIDRTLQDLIVLSLSSLKGVNDVQIQINGEEMITQQTSQIEYNYIQL